MSISGRTLPDSYHWAASPKEKIAETIQILAKDYHEKLNQNGTLDLWRRSYRTYYGLDIEGRWKNSCSVNFDGSNGELALVKVNQYASIIKAILAMATAARPAFYAKAVNTETKSLLEAPIATGLIETYYRKKGIEDVVQSDAETSIVLSEAYMHLAWDIGAGALAVNENGIRMREGDLVVSSVSPLNCIHDLDNKQDDLTWAIIVSKIDIWELISRYPMFKNQILAQRGAKNYPSLFDNEWVNCEPNSDKITLYTLYYKPTDAIPNGRYSLVVGDFCIYDGPGILTDSIPVVPLIPAKQIDTGSGHAPIWDLLVLQELYNAALSAIATNHDAFGVQNVYVPVDSELEPGDMIGGRRHIKYKPSPGAPNGGLPSSVNLLNTPPEAYNWPEILQSTMETLSGINSVVRGDPQTNLKSGAALALVQSLAVQFNSAMQKAVTRHNEKAATVLLAMIKAHASSDIIVETIGKGKARYLKQVRKDEIEKIENVTVESANPIMSQTSGRLEIANDLLDKGLIKTKEEYLTVLDTGQLGAMTDSTTNLLDTISIENDQLKDGILPIIEETDDHGLHVAEHLALLDPATRKNKAVADVIKKHVTEHYQMWAKTPQDMAALCKWTIMPPAPIMPPPGPPPPPNDMSKGADAMEFPKPNENQVQPMGANVDDPNLPSLPEPAKPPGQ